MSDQFEVVIVDDPQILVVEVKTLVMPDIEVTIPDDPTALVVEVDNGIVGPVGPTGPGVPTGGTANQALTKIDGTNYSTQWSTVDKNFVGLGNVDNTSDLNKPISNATQTALNLKEDSANKSTNAALGASDVLFPSQNAVKTYVDNAVALGATPDATALVKGKVKLAGDLSGTADLPTVPGLATKEPTIAPGTTGQYWRGDKSWQTLDKNAVGLGNVDNTSDLSKPISTATQTALNLKEDTVNKSTNTSLGTSNTLYPSQNAVKVYVDAQVGAIDSNIDAYRELQKEPTGFPNRVDSVTSFNDGTLTFTIAPAVSSFDVYIKGHKFTKSASESIAISSSAGNHFFYYDMTGTLSTTQVIDSEFFQNNAFISIVYWNTDTNSSTYFAEERHGLIMDGMTHSYLHSVFGARYISGGALQGFSVDGTGNLASDAQFTSDSGSIRDEDLLIQYPAQATIPILYRQGVLWRKKPADSFPVIYSGTAGYTGANGRLPYNQLVSGNWQLTQVSNNQFVLVHIFATNDKNTPIVGVQGINQYNSISGARTGALSEISSLAGLPFAEFVALGSVIFETANTYSNTPKARVRSTDTGANYVDFRGTQPYAPSASVASSHGLLSGLSNDDHLQYHTDARGDVRYYTKTESDLLMKVNAIIFG